MSQERLPANIEVPSPRRYRFLHAYLGRSIRKIDLTTSGLETVPCQGPVSAVANHRNNKWDVPILGYAISSRRSPFYPAKSELNHGLKGWLMRGSGALFFERDNPEEEKRVYELMNERIAMGHMVLTMIEGTSKNRGPKLGKTNGGPLRLAVRNGLDNLVLMGLGGTEMPKVMEPEHDEDPGEVDDMRPERVHLEIASLPLAELTEPFKALGKPVHAKALHEFQNEVLVPSLQETVDIAYEKAALKR